MEAEGNADPIPQPWTGHFGIDLLRDFRVVCNEVMRGGAAEKAGMKVGDIFVAVNGVQTPTFFEFRDAARQLTAGQTVTWTVERKGKNVDIKYELPKLDLEAEETEEGGWAYYPGMEESPSFSTAAALLVLKDIEQDLDIKGLRQALKSPIRAAINLMHTLRVQDKDNGGMETYVYRGGSKEHGPPGMDIRGCQGRNTCCELALVRVGARGRSSLKRMVDMWLRYRGELDVVRRMELYHKQGYMPSPHNADRWFNAAYYWMFGHYHTLLAAKECGQRSHKQVSEICVKALMLTRMDDGCWLDHVSFEKLIGTCLALWVFGETEGGWRGPDPAAPGPITQPDKGSPSKASEDDKEEEGEPKTPKVPDGALD
jgi:hypothetical protein